MKTLYWNGASDVQITKHAKQSKRIGTASIRSVFAAKQEGDLRLIKLANGHNVGVTVDVWDAFMALHDSEHQRELNAIASLPNL